MMPKVIELTIEIDIQKVSCPGVWLCQDGRVSLTVFALGTSYQTCLLPPMFPLMFRDVFYFRKRFQESCALSNICCLLKDETIYCELVQWCEDCSSGECVILAQYLGSLNDVLFPPNVCSTDGVDLLMRRSKDFPGILSPKIEIATKVRIDEIWSQGCGLYNKVKACHCGPSDSEARQKQVCHSAQYHRTKCNQARRMPSRSRSRSRTRSEGSRSCCSLVAEPAAHASCRCPNPLTSKSRISVCQNRRPRRQYNVYNVDTSDVVWGANNSRNTDVLRTSMESDLGTLQREDRIQKLLLESHYIDYDKLCNTEKKKYNNYKMSPCLCEICKRYHELFHTDS
ncbi:spermatogenesis associated 6-like protein isoform X1 [Pieris napi]|uniref:spermatogenesis associated 6-like protein isoform X1 n=1 Tax=Pieris napi TaxID=78633 RepID=UPI001FBB9071|nr:spermatogenesis associated 6-like protein isoform X1 [Pieris napi]